MQSLSISYSYIEKQRKFRSLVKDIQTSLIMKEYLNQGLSFNDYVKMRWNISQAQAYRYVMCAKVLDQLKEFEIQPSYERVCHTLNHTVKNESQLKLLWSIILQKAGTVPESINSTHIKKIWKEICMDERYSHICQSEETIAKRIEDSLNKFSMEKKHKQMNKMNQMKKKNQEKSTKNNQKKNFVSQIPSPVLSESSSTSNPIENNKFYINNINLPLSPNDDFNNSLSESNSINFKSVNTSTTSTMSSSESLYYVLSSNNIQYQSQSLNNIQYQSQPSNSVQYQSQPSNSVQYQSQPLNNVQYQSQPSYGIQYQPQSSNGPQYQSQQTIYYY